MTDKDKEPPVCSCAEFYGSHHPECPVKRLIEAQQARIAELERNYEITRNTLQLRDDEIMERKKMTIRKCADQLNPPRVK
jgi:hypothetical protein